jgi:hypothetical protein
MFSQGSDGALPTTARRAKRENGGLGEDPPGSTVTSHQVLRTWMLSQGSDGALPMTARRAKRENGGMGDPPGSTITYQLGALSPRLIRLYAGQGAICNLLEWHLFRKFAG